MFNVTREFSVDRRFVAAITFLLYGVRLQDKGEPVQKISEALEVSEYRSMVHVISHQDGAQETIDEVFKTYPWDLAVEVAAAKMLRQYGGVASISRRVAASNVEAGDKAAAMLHKLNQIEDRFESIAERMRAGEGAPAPAEEAKPADELTSGSGLPEQLKEHLRGMGIDPERVHVQTVNLSDILRERENG